MARMRMSVEHIECAVMAAEHAARAALLEHDLDVTGLVVTVAFRTPNYGELVAASVIPEPTSELLALSLQESAVEAGWPA